MASAGRSTLLSLAAALQRRVRRYPTLIQAIRTTRNLVHFGPWRPVALGYLRLTSPPAAPASGQPSAMLAPVEVPAAVRSLEEDGYFPGMRVRPELVEESAAFWRDRAPGVYIDVHLQSTALARMASDPEVLRVVRAYFGCEPTLVECKLFVSDVSLPDVLATGFHFDHAGVRSLNVMVYLTPVDLETGPHVLVAGTHRNKKLRDYFREMTPIEEIERRYPRDVRVVTGPAGSVLLENAEVFHRRLQAQRRRVAMITVFSTSRRRVLSVGKDQRVA